MLLTSDRRPRGVVPFSAKAQKEAFAHKFHRRLLLQHQTGVCIHQHHLGTERRTGECILQRQFIPFLGCNLSCGVSHQLRWSHTSAGIEIFWYTNAKPGHSERHQRRENCAVMTEKQMERWGPPQPEGQSTYYTHPSQWGRWHMVSLCISILQLKSMRR